MEYADFEPKAKAYMGPSPKREMTKWHDALRLLYGVSYTWEEAEDYLASIREKEDARVAHREVAQAPQKEDEIQERLTPYLERFVPETPNDMQQLRMMVALELQLEKIQRDLANREGYDGTEGFKEMVDLQRIISTEYRQIQAALGIDRRTRDAEAGGSGVREQVEETIAQAAEFYKQRMVEIVHCGIKIGHLLPHFDKWELRMTCPRCGEIIIKKADEVDKPYVDRKMPVQRLPGEVDDDSRN